MAMDMDKMTSIDLGLLSHEHDKPHSSIHALGICIYHAGTFKYRNQYAETQIHNNS